MPIDYSTLSPEDMLALNASDYYPDLGTISALDNGLLQFDSNVGFPPPESPSMLGRIIAGINEPMNWLGNRAVSGLHQLGSALYNAATGSSASDIVSIINEIDAQRQAEDQRRLNYIMGKDGSSLTPMEHALNAAGVVIPGASAAKSLIRGAARNALASSAARNAMRAGQAAQTIGRANRTVDEMLPFARGTNFTNDDAIRFLQAAENPNGVRSALADIVRNDNMLRSSINTSNSIDDTVDMFTRAGRLDPETYVTLNNMKSGADIVGDIAVARQPSLRANLGSEINSAARNSINNAEAVARAAGENLPRAWRGMSNSELLNFARDNTIREAWLNRLARQDLRNTLPNFGRSYAGFGLAGGYGNALGDAMSDLPYNAEAEARLAEVALSEPTSLKPTGTDTTVPATTVPATTTNSITATNPDTMIEASRAGAPDLYASYPTDIVSDGLPFSDDGTVSLSPLLAEYQKTLQQTTEATNKEREKLIKQIEDLRNIQARDPFQWETRVQLERQRVDAIKRAENSFRDNIWNYVGSLLHGPIALRNGQNPFDLWDRNIQDYVNRDPEVQRLNRLLGYTQDLPSGSDRADSESKIIEKASKINFDLLNASLKEQQALVEMVNAYNNNVTQRRKNEAETKWKQAQTEKLEKEKAWVDKVNEARTNFYNRGGANALNPAVVSSFLNQNITGASPLVGNN